MDAWTESLSVGIDIIDRQHKELLRFTSKLIAAIRNGEGDQTITETLTFLEGYIEEHFGIEEKMMLLHQYPAKDEHFALHTVFRNNFVQIRQEAVSGASDSAFQVKIKNQLVDWLVQHISSVDRRLAQYLRDKNASI